MRTECPRFPCRVPEACRGPALLVSYAMLPSPAQCPSRKVVKAEKESTEEESPPSPAIKNEAVAATSVTDQKKSPAIAEELPLDTKPEKLEELKIEIKEETVNVPGADGSKKPIENQSDDVFSPTPSAADASAMTLTSAL